MLTFYGAGVDRRSRAFLVSELMTGSLRALLCVANLHPPFLLCYYGPSPHARHVFAILLTLPLLTHLLCSPWGRRYNDKVDLPWRTRLVFASDVAKGMA